MRLLSFVVDLFVVVLAPCVLFCAFVRILFVLLSIFCFGLMIGFSLRLASRVLSVCIRNLLCL